MAKHRGALFWSRHVAAVVGSGLSKAAYCRRHGLDYKTFLRWSRRRGGGDAAAQSLIPLSVAPAVPADAGQPLRLEVGARVVLLMPRSVDARWLGELLRTAASC